MLINLLFQAVSAIQEHFPESRIIKRLHILSQPDAKLFFQQWTGLRGQEEAANAQISVLRNAFHETPTRNAFSTFAAQIHGMNQFIESTAENLSLLTRRTESFSPSKHSSQLSCRPPLNITLCNLFASGRPTVPCIEPETSSSNLSTPTIPSQIHANFLTGNSESPTSSSPLSLEPQPSRQPDLTLDGGQVCPTTSPGFTSGCPASDILTPTVISVSNQCIYHVLPLSPLANPGQILIHTLHDLILPPASAFSSSAYPIFTTVECTWQYILDRVVNPSLLWSSYAPGSLGDYEDVKSIWQAWDEGAYIKDVGHKPALRLIDARWGNRESQETHKRKFPSWRPRNDNKVSSTFFFLSSGYQRSLIISYSGPQDMVKFLFFHSPH